MHRPDEGIYEHVCTVIAQCIIQVRYMHHSYSTSNMHCPGDGTHRPHGYQVRAAVVTFFCPLIILQVQETPQHSDKMAGVRSLNVEFSRETLDTMLDGLGKIRKQLSSVAAK